MISQYWHPEQGVVQRRLAWILGDAARAGHHITAVVPPPHYPGGQLMSDDPRNQTGAVDRSTPHFTVYRCRFRPHDASIVSRVQDQAVIMCSQIITASRAIRNARAAGNPVEVIVCTVPALPSAFVAYALSRLHRLPLVVELRDAWPEILEYIDQWNDPQRPTMNPWAKTKRALFHVLLLTGGRALRFVLSRADLLITTTGTLAAEHTRRGHPNVIAVRNRAGSGIPNCNAYPARGFGPLRVFYGGTVGRAQGLTNAIEAVALAKQQGVEVELRITGGGVFVKALERLAHKLAVDVDFTGRIPFEEMVGNYQWADTVLVHLQNWRPMEYTIPSKLFEIMWAEKHVTAAVAGEAAQIVAESQIGDVVPPMDPQALADLWVAIAQDRSRLAVDGRGNAWFRQGSTLEELTDRWVHAIGKVVNAQHQPHSPLSQRTARKAQATFHPVHLLQRISEPLVQPVRRITTAVRKRHSQ
ncbi:putative glycosyl transferase [Corynebacterium choanae]|uniref:Putative glycosyl transferase n=2 Tax=Corynebacterium choanae TaxID=1862358 RepID=A0A3G6J3N0_9CORY|nr:putative glycosyl transferase [Corynebacterium choanae]